MVLRSVRWLSLILFALIAGLLLAQKPSRPPEEEEDPPKTGTKKPEVEDTPIVKKRIIHVNDDPDPPRQPPKQPELVVDLAQAAKTAKLPIKQMFQDVAKPIDIVHISGLNQRTENSEPVNVYVPPKGTSKGKVTLRPIKADGTPGKPVEMQLNDNCWVEYYEHLALARIKEFRTTRFENALKDHPNYLTVEEQLIAVEQALTAVLRFHEAARKSGDRVGDEWNPIQEAVRTELLTVVMERLQLVVDRGDWDESLALAQQLKQRFPAIEDQRRIAKPLVKLVQQVLAGGINEEQKYLEAQRRLDAIAQQFPFSDATKDVSDALFKDADKLVQQAKQSKEKKDAARLIQLAAKISPQYPGIRALTLEYGGAYPILRVGVPQLPVYLSPALAHTEAEMQAIEMMFESLVQLQADGEGGTFVGQLAPGRPQTLPLGREFVLPRDVYWTNKRPLNAISVGETVRRLRSEWPGRNEAWCDLIESASVQSDSHRVKVQMSQGYIEPLAAMNFKILPPSLNSPDDREFAKKPVSSGPFEFSPQQQSFEGRPYAMFKANPYYSNRPGRSTVPYIREIQFFEPVDPVEELSKGFLHLWPDVPADKVAALRQKPGVEVSLPMPTRRVYFLAVNHRDPVLAQPSFRRALAHALQRDKLLDGHFRAADGEKRHQALNGPYPPHSWAYNPQSKSDLYDATQARTQLELAEKARAGSKGKTLTLKYPLGDKQLEAAMFALAVQLKTELGIEIKTEGLDPHQLWEDVRERHRYDLAYWHYDYPDPMFDVWPLFDPRAKGPGGLNYLGYEPSADFTKLFQDARSHRDFKRVRELIHLAHDQMILKEMPLIPLWHLDRQIAFHSKLTMYQGNQKVVFEKDKLPPLDPLRLFGSVETWKVEP